MEDAQGGADAHHRAAHRMRVGDEDFPRLCVRVIHKVFHVQGWTRRDASLLQYFHQVVGLMVERPLTDVPVQLILVLPAATLCVPFFILRPSRATHHLDHGLPFIVTAHLDGNPGVGALAGVHAMWRHHFVPVADGLADVLVHGIVVGGFRDG